MSLKIFSQKSGVLVSDLQDLNLNDPETNYWLSLENPSEEELNNLQKKFGFSEDTIAECRDWEHYPKIEDYENYLFLVTFFLEGSKSTELNLFLGSNYLITICKNTLPVALKNLELRSKKLLIAKPDFLLSEILDSLAESYIGMLESFDQKIDHLENLLFRSTDERILKKIFEIKKQLVDLKRLLFPQQEMLFRLSFQEHDLISERNRLLLRNVYDHFNRLTYSMESYRDSIFSLFDAYRSQASNGMNRIMKTLTIFSVIILPLTLLTSYYGMNVVFMPELQWKNGPALVLGLMFGVSILMLVLFKWRKWL